MSIIVCRDFNVISLALFTRELPLRLSYGNVLWVVCGRVVVTTAPCEICIYIKQTRDPLQVQFQVDDPLLCSHRLDPTGSASASAVVTIWVLLVVLMAEPVSLLVEQCHHIRITDMLGLWQTGTAERLTSLQSKHGREGSCERHSSMVLDYYLRKLVGNLACKSATQEKSRV